MDKGKLHHIWRTLRPISYWYFLVLCLLFAVLGVVFLRQNNLQAINLRDHVLQVDKDNGDVETALRQLREYIYTHMNTDLSSGNLQQPIQLKYRYERLAVAEKAKADAANAQVYTEAQRICEQKFPASFSGGPRVPCIQDYVTSHGTQPQAIPDALYKFSFVSPRWSLDRAGISLLLSAVFFILFVIRLALERFMRASLKQHQ